MAAADVGDASALAQLRFDPVERRNPSGDQIGGVTWAEEPLGSLEESRIMFVPAHTTACAKGFRNFRLGFDSRNRRLERAGQEGRAAFFSKRERLLRRERVAASRRVVIDVAA